MDGDAGHGRVGGRDEQKEASLPTGPAWDKGLAASPVLQVIHVARYFIDFAGSGLREFP
jgi:hypothetical protein